MIILFITIVLFIQPSQQITAACNLQVGSATINTATTYQITYTASVSNKLTKITVYFPYSVFPTAPASVSCTATLTTYFGTLTPTCTLTTVAVGSITTSSVWSVTASTTVASVIHTIQNSFSEQATPYFTNPTTSINELGYCGTTVSSGSFDSNVKLSLSVSKFAATTITSAVLSSSPTTNGASTTLTATLTLVDLFTSAGDIVVSFPRQTGAYVGYGLGTSSDSMIIGCSATSCSPTLSSSTVQVYYGGSTATNYFSSGVASYGNPIDLITIKTSIGSTGLAAGGVLTVIIANIYNPPSFSPVKCSIWTADSLGNVENTQAAVYLTSLSMGSFQTGGAITISNNNLVTQSPATYSFYLINDNPIPTSSKITIVLPSGISLLSSFTVTCVLYCDSTAMVYSYNSATTTITISGLFSTSYIASGSPIKFDIVGFTNPSVVGTYQFAITSWDLTAASGTAYAIDYINTLYVSPQPGVITITSILPTDSTRIYDLPTSYTFKLTSSIAMASTNVLVVVFPSDFVVQSNTTCKVTGLKSTYSCIPYSSNNTIILKTFLSSTLSASVQVPTFTVTCIKNPGTYAATGSIVVTQYTNTFGEMATGSYIIKANYFTYNYIETFSVITSNYNAGQYPTNYTFTVMPRATVPQGAYLTLSLPSDIQMPSSSSVSKYCGGTAMSGFNANAGLYCTVSSSTYIVQVQQGFSAGASSSDPPTLVFTILYLKNPRSTQTTDPFNITVHSSGNKMLYSWNYTALPTVTMTGAATPNSIAFQRDTTTNGALATYYWIIQNNNYYINGDFMIIKAPSPIQFSIFSTCTGINDLKMALACSVSSDLYTINITVATNMRRQLATGKIPGSSSISLNITNILNAPSFRPTTNSFAYNVYSSGGYQIESQSSNLNVTNTLPGILAYSTTGVSPSSYNYNAEVDYTITFVPKNYEIGMYIYITVPTQLAFPSSQIKCASVIGAESTITCLSSATTRKIKISNAFLTTRTSPYLIKITLSTLTNPSNKLITDSFQIETYTSDSYKMDQLTTGLTINFICTYPCKSCDVNNNSYCYSCYTTDLQKYFYQSSCLTTCPTKTYADATNVSCNNCTSPCATCVNSSATCLTCISGYTLNGTSCYMPTILGDVLIKNDNIISFFYPWPFVACSFILTILVLICILCKKETKFRESIIALVAWPEFLSWIALACYQYYEYELTLFFVLVAGGILVQVILNIAYGIAHQKRIIPLSSEGYRNFLIDNHKCSVVTLMMSFLFTFKFHHLMISFLGNGEHLKGEFNRPAWKVWNGIAITSILFSYIPIAGSCVLYLLQTNLFGTVLYFLNIEVLVISTYIAILLLMGIFRTCCCTCNLKSERRRKKEGSREEKYNEVKNDSSSMIHEESTKKNKKSKLDEMIDEEDIEINTSTIKRKNKRRHDFIYTQNIEDEEEYDEQNISKRHRETEPLTAENKKYEQKYQEEMEKLIKMTEMLKNQQELHNFEKRLILQERERVLRDKDEKYREIETMKTQLKEEKEEIRKERAKLVDQRDEFLEQVDKRVKQRIEDWEMQSMRSITTIAKRLKIQDEMNNIEQSIQTTKRMHEVTFNVDVIAETKEQMKQRLLHQPEVVTKEETIQKKYEQKTMGKIVEEEYDSDDLNQILKKADEVLQQQQESNGEIQSALHPLKSVYEKDTLNYKEIEKDQELIIKQFPKPAFEVSEKDERFTESEPVQFINYLPKAIHQREDIIREDILQGDDTLVFQNEQAKYDIISDNEQLQKNLEQEEVFFNMTLHKPQLEADSLTKEIDLTQQNFFINDKAQFEHIGNNERELDASQQNFFVNNKPQYEHIVNNDRELDASQQNFYINDSAKFEKVDNQNRELDSTQQNFFVNDKPQFEHLGNNERELDGSQQNFFVNDKPKYEHIGNNERELDATQQNFFNNDKAQFEHNDNDAREVQMSEDIIEPFDNKPYFNKTDSNFNKGEKQSEEVSIQLPDSYKQQQSITNGQQIQNQEDYIDVPVKPEFKQIDYQNEDDIEMKTQYNDDLDEIKIDEEKQVNKNVNIEAEDLDKGRDFAKKKKKVLYSDKSESSVDEMMEDTPSNYNIPNGRLDGKSMGIKSVLMYANKLGLHLPVGGTPNLTTQKNPQLNTNTPNILNQNRLANPPKPQQQDEERKFVNNLFKDNNGNQGQIGIGGSKSIAKNLSVPRQNDRNQATFDSGNEASWRAFNQPVGKVSQIVGGNDTTQTIPDGHQHTIENNDDDMIGGKKKKKKVVNAQKQFKEPPPNVERIKALESAYIGGKQNNGESTTGRQNQEFSSGRAGKNQPLNTKAVLPHRIGGGFGVDTTPHETEEKKANRLMKNNFL